jgi:SAM-dependent methyltransferase
MTQQPADRFDQPQVWGGLHEMPEIQHKIAVFLQSIPSGVESLLDVGCGDGAITNRLGERYSATGVDASSEALKHLRVEARQANASALPFPDRSFDLVMSSQMLEHLDDSAYAAAIAEMMRVTRRFLLISVPYREHLNQRTIRCPVCGYRQHVWGHRRSFTIESLLRDLPAFDVRDVRLFGRLQDPPWPGWLLLSMQRLLRVYYDPEGQGALCERCGNAEWRGAGGAPSVAYRLKRLSDRGRPRLPFWVSVVVERREEPADRLPEPSTR